MQQRAFNDIDEQEAEAADEVDWTKGSAAAATDWQPIELSADGKPITPEKTEAEKEIITDEEYEILYGTPSFVRGFSKGMSRNAWFLVFIFSYLAHITLNKIAPDFVSTSIWMILSPVVFAFLGYYYLLTSYVWSGTGSRVISGAVWEVATILSCVLIISILLARVRMQRVAINLKGTKWDMEVSARKNTGSILPIIARFDPIFYRPRNYKLCSEGVLIEGWNYVIAVPFEQTKVIRKRDKGDLASAGFYAVRTLDQLILLDILFSKEPVLIAPEKETIFLEKAREHLAAYKARSYHRGNKAKAKQSA